MSCCNLIFFLASPKGIICVSLLGFLLAQICSCFRSLPNATDLRCALPATFFLLSSCIVEYFGPFFVNRMSVVVFFFFLQISYVIVTFTCVSIRCISRFFLSVSGGRRSRLAESNFWSSFTLHIKFAVVLCISRWDWSCAVESSLRRPVHVTPRSRLSSIVYPFAVSMAWLLSSPSSDHHHQHHLHAVVRLIVVPLIVVPSSFSPMFVITSISAVSSRSCFSKVWLLKVQSVIQSICFVALNFIMILVLVCQSIVASIFSSMIW